MRWIAVIIIWTTLLYLPTLNAAEKTTHNDILPFDNIPTWVKNVNITTNESVSKENVSEGMYNRLYDQQIYAQENQSAEYFYRHDIEIVNEEGLENASQISIDYSPEYETLTFHTLEIVRDGVTTPQKENAQYRLLQRETDLENLMYSGELTASLILNDVRVGDTLRYSYSIIGDNPILNNHFSYTSDLEWSVPVGRQYLRIVWDKDTPLQSRFIDSDLELTSTQSDLGQEYVVQQRHVAIKLNEDDMPPWYAHWGRVHFSEMQSWSEVVNWALPLYNIDWQNDVSTLAIRDEIINTTNNKNEQISLALQRAQNDIRYLGLEMGVNSHKPSKPHDTWQRRWGDCKDKTVALTALLNALGFTAYPALVNTVDRRSIEQFVPSIGAFNHVIVALIHEDEPFYLDPTLRHQTGTFPNIYQPRYEKALHIHSGSNDIVDIYTDQHSADKHIENYFYIPDDPDTAVQFKVTTEYRGRSAERQRETFASKTNTAQQKSYLDYYSYYYPNIEANENLSINDNPSENIFLVEESYIINNFWEFIEEKNRDESTFYFPTILDYLDTPDEAKRTTPWYRQSNISITERATIEFEGDYWNFDDEDQVLHNEFFHLNYKANFDNNKNTLILSNRLSTGIYFISPLKIQQYLDEREPAVDYLSYGIYMERDALPTANNPSDTAQNNFDFRQIIVSDSSPIDDLTITWVGYILVCITAVIAFFIWLIQTVRSPTKTNEHYYAVSILKFYALALITFNIYIIYWYYRNWAHIKSAKNLQAMPFWRGFFSYIWYIPYARTIFSNGDDAPVWRVQAFYWIGGLVYFSASLASLFNYYGFTALIVMYACLLPILRQTNKLAQMSDTAPETYALKPKAAYLFAVPFCLGAYIISIGSETARLPRSSIISGEQLPAFHVKYLQRNHVVPVNEPIVALYSDALLDYRTDGNGYTKNTVFSYWRDSGTLNIERAKLSDVSQILLNEKNSFLDDANITIRRNNGEEFQLYISKEENRHTEFIRDLKRTWRKRKLEASSD